jgi:hypothetical protein
MELTIHTKSGTTHKLINGKIVPPITVPAEVHEKVLKRINDIRQERAYER